MQKYSAAALFLVCLFIAGCAPQPHSSVLQNSTPTNNTSVVSLPIQAEVIAPPVYNKQIRIFLHLDCEKQTDATRQEIIQAMDDVVSALPNYQFDGYLTREHRDKKPVLANKDCPDGFLVNVTNQTGRINITPLKAFGTPMQYTLAIVDGKIQQTAVSDEELTYCIADSNCIAAQIGCCAGEYRAINRYYEPLLREQDIVEHNNCQEVACTLAIRPGPLPVACLENKCVQVIPDEMPHSP